MRRIRRILHASDFSRPSRAAFAKAVELAKMTGAELVVAHVLGEIVPPLADGYVAPRVYAELESRSRAVARKEVDSLAAKARKSGVRTNGLLLAGAPHEQIARAAKARRADVVVLGTHGRTGLARFFLGSVAGRVASIAPCPVMIVRGK